MPYEQGMDERDAEARGHRQDAPLSISQLNWYIKNVLENAVPKVWVEGEVTDLSQPSSGHIYFSLKDDSSQVRAVVWRSTAARLPFKIKDGQAVVCCGAVEVYPPRGSYQLIVQRMEPQGIGALQLAFQQLHQKLASQGLFQDERKKPLPVFPKRIGFVTSPTGAAIHDFLEASRHRWSNLDLTIIPARVQGEFAANEIVRGIQLAHKLRPRLDLLIVGRGGGSMEDLWCFNEEAVVRAISKCKIPVVSAVGHEIDVTLSDLAADARALTPTHAAQLVLPSTSELKQRLEQIEKQINTLVQSRAKAIRLKLEGLSDRGILTRPHEIHLSRRQRIDELEMRGRQAIWNYLGSKKELLRSAVRAAEALSPLAVLARGYSLTRVANSTQPLQSVADVSVGDTLETTLQHGKISSHVRSIDDGGDK